MEAALGEQRRTCRHFARDEERQLPLHSNPRIQMNSKTSFMYKKILSSRSVPILFILVCFLVIAHTRCDHVGSANVQKFHPNGRYGRRSVDNFARTHTELGKLINGDEQPNQSLARQSGDTLTLLNMLRRIGHDNGVSGGSAQSRNVPIKQHDQSRKVIFDDVFAPGIGRGDAASMASYQTEMNKLLGCNYTGISNLYWCAATASGA